MLFRVKALLVKHQPELVVLTNTPKGFCLRTRHPMKNGQPLWFGAVQMMMNYVSFHLVPVCGLPDLLENLSPELRKRMDAALFAELDQLTQDGFERCKTKKQLGI